MQLKIILFRLNFLKKLDNSAHDYVLKDVNNFV